VDGDVAGGARHYLRKIQAGFLVPWTGARFPKHRCRRLRAGGVSRAIDSQAESRAQPYIQKNTSISQFVAVPPGSKNALNCTNERMPGACGSLVSIGAG